MPSPIDKKTLEHLAKLARIELSEHEEEKLLRDLSAILDHFEELKTVDTAQVAPMAGGTGLVNTFREDTARESTNRGKGADAFPESEDGALKIPPVF
jgi:aspartyl-tRNA(Asn)/glutamyl-tRNA(Gln) amidotransferase subunit C